MEILYNSDIIDLAFEKADEWHGEQKYGDQPYVDSHIKDVYDLVLSKVKDSQVGYRNLCLTVAILHDALEDTEAKSSEIAQLFGVPACLAIECLTDPKGSNRKERKRKSYYRIRSNDVTILVKVADRLANMRNCVANNNLNLLKMYVREYDAFYCGLWSPYQYIQDWWEEMDEIVKNYRP